MGFPSGYTRHRLVVSSTTAGPLSGSYRVIDSILITSAPRSPRIRAQNGPAHIWEKSITLIPLSGASFPEGDCDSFTICFSNLGCFVSLVEANISSLCSPSKGALLKLKGVLLIAKGAPG